MIKEHRTTIMVVHPGGRIMANVNQPVASAEVYESLFQALVTLIRMVIHVSHYSASWMHNHYGGAMFFNHYRPY
jgi:hypothetical protein